MCEEYLDWDTEEWSRENFIFSNFSSLVMVYISALLKKYIMIVRWNIPKDSQCTHKLYFKRFKIYLVNFITNQRKGATYARREREFYGLWQALGYESILNEIVPYEATA